MLAYKGFPWGMVDLMILASVVGKMTFSPGKSYLRV